MNLETFEKNLKSHNTNLSEMLSAILETEVENQALLRTILINQAIQFEKFTQVKQQANMSRSSLRQSTN